MNNWSRFLLVLALVLGALLPAVQPQPAQAADWGYLWRGDWDFEAGYDGVLTIEVGPWKNGELVKAVKTSTAPIRCEPVGGVHLDSGDAVFTGGYIQCRLDLAATVLANHGLVVDPVDNYGSIVLRAKVNGAANTVAPLFAHPDAAYTLDFTQTSALTLEQELSTGAGPLQATFPGVTINTWQSISFLYGCNANGGPCEAIYSVGAQQQNMPTAGSRVQFSTGPTVFDIGRNGGDLFSGRVEALSVDPGNSLH